jgi:HlyD family secretion protein
VSDSLLNTAAIPPAERLQIPELNRRVRNARSLWVGLLIAAVGLGVFAYTRRGQSAVEMYRSEKITRRDVLRVVESSGHVDAVVRYEVPAPFPGRLTEIAVVEGARVTRGQVLARLDDREGVFAVRNASAAQKAAVWRITDAQSALSAAKEDQARVERLSARGLASPQEVAATKNAAARAKAALEAARAQQDVTEAQLASAEFTRLQGEITSPIDGVVLVAPENIGSGVGPDRPLFVVAEPLERVRVDVNVAEGDIGEVRAGQEGSFEVLSYPGRVFRGHVERVAVEPRRDGGVVSYEVRLIADNPGLVLLPGMTATVRLTVARAEHALTVRDAALRFNPPGYEPAPARSRVFLHTGVGQLRAVGVRPGLSDGMNTVIEPATPADAALLQEGALVAMGVLSPERVDRGQPGLSLGGK